MKECPNKCDCFIWSDDKFCPQCGVETIYVDDPVCPKCGSAHLDHHKFCPKCAYSFTNPGFVKGDSGVRTRRFPKFLNNIFGNNSK